MSTYRRVPILLAVLLLTVVPIAIAADPSSSPDPSASVAPDTSSPEASPSPSVAPATASPSPASPTLAPTATPAATPAPAATAAPKASPQETGKPDKDKEKGPEKAITLTGKVGESTNGKGWKVYTLTVGSTVYELGAGPPWFWGDKNPLAAYVGKTITVVGTTRQGSSEIDAETVDGKALRGPGRPPWAGGPWVVGERHPGWKDWMAGGKPGHGQGHGRDHAPGQLKD
jgi:hypothetical protein